MRVGLELKENQTYDLGFGKSFSRLIQTKTVASFSSKLKKEKEKASENLEYGFSFTNEWNNQYVANSL